MDKSPCTMRFISCFHCLFFLIILFACSTEASDKEKETIPSRPNIVWIMAEDMGQDLGLYGTKGVQTPNLDRMGNEGMLLRNCLVPNPICSTSRTAMMTAMHQTRIGAHHHRSNRNLPLSDSIKPITYYLREQGYTCILGFQGSRGNGGKLDCNFKHTARGPYNGVDQFGLFDTVKTWNKTSEPFFSQITLNVTHRGDWWKEVRSQSNDPVDPNEIELPPYLPDHPKVREQWAMYLDQVERMDAQVGEILADLEEKDLLDNTLIFFIGDNGRCEVRGKGYLYESGINVPGIIWGEGIIPEINTNIVSTLDLSATILDLAGVELPNHIKALPIIGKNTGEPRKYFYAARDGWDEINECSRAIRTQNFKYIKNYLPELPWDQHQAYVDFHRPAIHVMRQLKKAGTLSQYASIFLEDQKPKEELYDLRSDPHELNNLAQDPNYDQKLAEMRAYLMDWQKNNHDAGLEDLGKRKLNLSRAGKVREYLKNNEPEAWQAMVDGEIGDSYAKWVKKVYSKK